MKRLLFFASSVAVFFGCSPADPSVDGVPVDVSYSITAVMEELSADAVNAVWSSEDEIYIHTTEGGVVGTLTSGAGGLDATFDYGAYLGELTGDALYPYASGNFILEDSLNVVLPSSYALGSSMGDMKMVMYGRLDGKNLCFTHLVGMLGIPFENVPSDVNSFKITLDKKINGNFTAGLAAEYPEVVTCETADADECSITLDFDALESESSKTFYVPLPVGTYGNVTLSLSDSEGEVWSFSNQLVNTISRGSVVMMPAIVLAGDVEGETDLSESGTANCYIVSGPGAYSFASTKGNSNVGVGAVASVEVLWETFGTDEVPVVGSLIKAVKCSYDRISFETADVYKEGNAVIAAKDADGTILWSWHIWLTDQPEGQEYYNNAGTVMDRNLGATSATPGDAGTLGLLYQWGRKDPFMGGVDSGTTRKASSTIEWPTAVISNSSIGTIEYAVAHPTVFITQNEINKDWYYTDSDWRTDNTRWTTSGKPKSIYDPCPQGWRVPGDVLDGFWYRFKSDWFEIPFDSNRGLNFSGTFGDAPSIWYPMSGRLEPDSGDYTFASLFSHQWCSTTYRADAIGLYFSAAGYVEPLHYYGRAYGLAVRCVQE